LREGGDTLKAGEGGAGGGACCWINASTFRWYIVSILLAKKGFSLGGTNDVGAGGGGIAYGVSGVAGAGGAGMAYGVSDPSI